MRIVKNGFKSLAILVLILILVIGFSFIRQFQKTSIAEPPVVVDLSNLTDQGSPGYAYSSIEASVRLTEPGEYKIIGSTTTVAITVQTSTPGVHITLSDVNIDLQDKSPLTISPSEQAIITLEGENYLTAVSTFGFAGLNVQDTARLTIEGEGYLEATGGEEGAGIGGSGYGRGGVGTIIINSGNILAKGGAGGAGIGGGDSSSGGNIGIFGGDIEAISGVHGAGIGGGTHGSGASGSGDIYIAGGNIIATADGQGAGIGSGSRNSGSNINDGRITISGGSIHATGGTGGGAGIGGGVRYNGGRIDINAGTISAIASGQGAGIGGGWTSSGGAITIHGGNIYADSTTASNDSNCGASIGGGSEGSAGRIRIDGGNINAVANSYPGPDIPVGIGIGGSGDTNIANEGTNINGGNISVGAITPTPGNQNGSLVYQNILTFSTSSFANKPIDTLVIDGIYAETTPAMTRGAYGIRDLQTDDTESLKIYLPTTSALDLGTIWTAIDGVVYSGIYQRDASARSTTLHTPKISIASVGLDSLEVDKPVSNANLIVRIYSETTDSEIAHFTESLLLEHITIQGLPPGLEVASQVASGLSTSDITTSDYSTDNTTVTIPIVGTPTAEVDTAQLALEFSSDAFKGKLPPMSVNHSLSIGPAKPVATSPNTTSPSKKITVSSANTGDGADILLIICLIFVSVSLLCLILRKRRRHIS